MADLKGFVSGLTANNIIYQINYGDIWDAAQAYREEMDDWCAQINTFSRSVGAKAWRFTGHREIIFDFNKEDKPKRWVKAGNGWVPRHTAKAWPDYERLNVSPDLMEFLKPCGFTGEYEVKQRNTETDLVSAVSFSAIARPHLHWEHITNEGTYFFLTIVDPAKFRDSAYAYLADEMVDTTNKIFFAGMDFERFVGDKMTVTLPEYRDYIVARHRWRKAMQRQYEKADEKSWKESHG